jgi:hypothetical protein
MKFSNQLWESDMDINCQWLYDEERVKIELGEKLI